MTQYETFANVARYHMQFTETATKMAGKLRYDT
jgi:hypothetical protein